MFWKFKPTNNKRKAECDTENDARKVVLLNIRLSGAWVTSPHT